MSFCIRPSACKKCGKPLTLFEGRYCLECEKAEQEPILDKIRAEIEQTVEHEINEDKKWAIGLKYSLQIIDKYRTERSDKE